MSRYYSPLNNLMFYALGQAAEVASRIDSLFVSPAQATMPTYITPDASFLASRTSEINDRGYEENATSQILNYATCLVSEVDKTRLNNVVDEAHVTSSASTLKIELGNITNGCHFSSTMPRNEYTVGQIQRLEGLEAVERYQAAELEVFKSAVLSSVQQAINYKKAQYNAIGRPYFIKERDLMVNVAADWWESCPLDLAELVATNNDDFNVSSWV